MVKLNLNLDGSDTETKKFEFIENHIKEDSVVIDAGACIGYFTKKFIQHLNSQGTLIAFEPEKVNFKVLKQIDNYECNLILENMALSNFCGETTLFLGPHKGYHSLKNTKKFSNGKTQKTMVTTIDDYLFNLGISHLDILKMDVEGLSLEVLQGTTNTIDNSKAMIILAEIHIHHNIDEEAIFKFLIDKKFHIYDIKESNGKIIKTGNSLTNEIIAIKAK